MICTERIPYVHRIKSWHGLDNIYVRKISKGTIVIDDDDDTVRQL